MPLAVYFHPEPMSVVQYEIMKKLDESGQAAPKGRTHH